MIITVIGTYLLIGSNAVIPTTSLEPEAGTFTGNATKISDSTASNQFYVQFRHNENGLLPIEFPLSLFDSGAIQKWPQDSNSATIANNFVLAYQQHYGSVTINTQPFYTVAADTPLVTMNVASGCNNFTTNTGSQIPIPSYVSLNGSTDNPLSIYQPSTHTAWEFWRASPTSTAGVWQACWGGKLTPSTSSGVFASPYGRSATGISEWAIAITEADVASGTIKHTIGVGVPACTHFIYPANRGDCSYDTGQPAEGQMFRFPASEPCNNLGNSYANMVCAAIRDYGMVVTDYSGAVSIEGEQQSDWTAQGYSGTDPITTAWAGKARYAVVANLPWSNLQVVDPPNPYTP